MTHPHPPGVRSGAILSREYRSSGRQTALRLAGFQGKFRPRRARYVDWQEILFCPCPVRIHAHFLLIASPPPVSHLSHLSPLPPLHLPLLPIPVPS